MSNSELEDFTEPHEAEFAFYDEKGFLVGAALSISDTWGVPFTLSLTINGNNYEVSWAGEENDV